MRGLSDRLMPRTRFPRPTRLASALCFLLLLALLLRRRVIASSSLDSSISALAPLHVPFFQSAMMDPSTALLPSTISSPLLALSVRRPDHGLNLLHGSVSFSCTRSGE